MLKMKQEKWFFKEHQVCTHCYQVGKQVLLEDLANSKLKAVASTDNMKAYQDQTTSSLNITVPEMHFSATKSNFYEDFNLDLHIPIKKKKKKRRRP